MGLLSAASDDHHTLSRLAEYSGGFALWGADSRHLGILFSALNDVLTGNVRVRAARFRVESQIPNAFQSGGTVLGTVHFEHCPWYCSVLDIPFAVRIP
jgi:hypothetical protein